MSDCNPTLLIVIVNYKVGKLTADCLLSLEPEMAAFPNSRVVVVDNHSQDGSADEIARSIEKRQWSDWARLVRSPTNGGFAFGNNLGIRVGLEQFGGSSPDFVLLLNPDTVVRPEALQTLVDFLVAHSGVGIAGGRSEDPDETPQHCCFRFPNALNEFAANARLGVVDKLLRNVICRVPIAQDAHPIDWVSGAFMLVRREVLEHVGLFDEGYFLYYEETDLIHRARKAGWTCWHVPGARVVHLVGYSSGVTIRHRRPDRKPRYWFDSRRRYFLKQRGKCYAAWADGMAILGLIIGRLRAVLTTKKGAYPPRILWDMFRNSVFVRGFRLRDAVVPCWKGAHPTTAHAALPRANEFVTN